MRRNSGARARGCPMSDAMARAKAAIRLVLSESKAWTAVFDPATADLLAERIVRASFPILAEDLVAAATSYATCECGGKHGPCNVNDAPLAIASALRARIAEIAGGRDG